MSDGTIDVAESTRRRRLLDAAEHAATLPQSSASGGGYPPSVNGRAGAAYGLPLTLPATVAVTSIAVLGGRNEIYAASSGFTASQVVAVLAAVLRWGIYGFLFGYLYPRLRGRDPMAKALGFTLVILLSETVRAIGAIGPLSVSSKIVVISAAVVPGLIMAAGLGLVWERRLTVEAGLSWRGVRKLRDFRTFTAPVVSIVIAVASSAATSAVGLLLSASPKGK